MVSYISMKQGSEILRTRVLEIRRSWKQVFPTCYWTTLCYIKGFGYLYIWKPVSLPPVIQVIWLTEKLKVSYEQWLDELKLIANPVCCQESGKGGSNSGFMYLIPKHYRLWTCFAKYALQFSFNLIFRHILHKYVNEDVSLGSWFIGLDVEHVDDKRICCGTPPGKFDTASGTCSYTIHLVFTWEIYSGRYAKRRKQHLNTCKISLPLRTDAHSVKLGRSKLTICFFELIIVLILKVFLAICKL
jgi:hypothetical protein